MGVAQLVLRSTPLSTRLQIVAAYLLLCSVYLHQVVQSARAGWPRFLACLPVLLGNCVVPLLFNPDTAIGAATTVVFLLVWLGNFKVLGLALDRGPLCGRKSFAQFTAIWALPVTPQEPQTKHSSENGHSVPRVPSRSRLTEVGGSDAELLKAFVAKLVGLCIVVRLLSYDLGMPDLLEKLVEIVGMYLFLGMLMDGPASVACKCVGLKIAPHFDRPYLTNSLLDFWSRRWNLTAGNSLRFLVYDPINERRLVNMPGRKMPFSKAWRMFGRLASFVVSGTMHEVVFWYLTGTVTGYWLAFFSIQGPMMWLESKVHKFGQQQRLKPPKIVSMAVSWTILLLVADWLFFPPVIKFALDERLIQNIADGYNMLINACWPASKVL